MKKAISYVKKVFNVPKIEAIENQCFEGFLKTNQIYQFSMVDGGVVYGYVTDTCKIKKEDFVIYIKEVIPAQSYIACDNEFSKICLSELTGIEKKFIHFEDASKLFIEPPSEGYATYGIQFGEKTFEFPDFYLYKIVTNNQKYFNGFITDLIEDEEGVQFLQIRAFRFEKGSLIETEENVKVESIKLVLKRAIVIEEFVEQPKKEAVETEAEEPMEEEAE